MSGSTLRVLAYHRIGSPGEAGGRLPREVSATRADFAQQMRHVAKRYRAVTLAQVVTAQRGGRPLPARAVLLTFDDGTRDFATAAWPVLQQYQLPATIFVPTAYPGDPTRRFWWERLRHALAQTRRSSVEVPLVGTLQLQTPKDCRSGFRMLRSRILGLPDEQATELIDKVLAELGAGDPAPRDVLDWDELRHLAAQGASLAAHTCNHAALTQLEPAAIAAEIAGSLADLDREIGDVLPVLCYPYGLHSDRVERIAAAAGIELAFSCLDGHNPLPASNPLRLRRTEITRRTTPAIFRMRLWPATAYIDRWRHRHKFATSGRDEMTPGEASADAGGALPRVAYIMSRFPKLSETFVLNEMSALDGHRARIELFPLLRESQSISHPEAERWTRRARFQPFLSFRILQANAWFATRDPRAYVGALAEVLRGTWGSWKFFSGALGVFPKSVRFALEMRALGVAHVHAHFATHPAVSGLIVHRLTGIPFSFTAHGSDLHVDRRMLAEKVSAAAFAVTVSEFNREVIVRECGEHLRPKVVVVHCGVDTGRFKPAATHSTRAPFQLVCVASFEDVKGHRFLVEACRLLRDRGVALRCHLVGDGPRRAAITEQITALALDSDVVVHGGLPQARVAELLAGADAAVLASHPTPDGRREGIPVALMEAMACGLPVVASAISGIPELVEDGVTGLLVPSGDPVALADALERLARDPVTRREMGAAGRQRIMREFDLFSNAGMLLDLILGVRPLSSITPAADRSMRPTQTPLLPPTFSSAGIT